MNNDIRVEITNLRMISGKMQEVVTSLGNIETAVNRIKSETEPIWIGKARDAYAKNCETIIKDTRALAEEIKKNKLILEESMSVYERTETSVAAKVTELSADDIFN